MSDGESKDIKKVKAGYARAKSLSKAERSTIARNAAAARWELASSVPKATHGDADHPLKIGGMEIPCYVLEDGRRVISQRGLQLGIGMNESGGAQRLLKNLASLESKGVDTHDLASRVAQPIVFKTANSVSHGYEAQVLADFCKLILSARKAGALQPNQLHLADRCEILISGFATVGIIALVDEATGYQEVRDRQALQEFLDRFLLKEYAAWAKRFPDDFYKEIFRLRGWKWRGMKVNRPQCVAQYTKDIVYARLGPGILKDLEAKNPVTNSGRRKANHHQWLTEDIGHPRLAEHIYGVIGLMRAVDDKDWSTFQKMLNRAYPRRGDSMQMSLFSDEDIDGE